MSLAAAMASDAFGGGAELGGGGACVALKTRGMPTAGEGVRSAAAQSSLELGLLACLCCGDGAFAGGGGAREALYGCCAPSPGAEPDGGGGDRVALYLAPSASAGGGEDVGGGEDMGPVPLRGRVEPSLLRGLLWWPPPRPRPRGLTPRPR